MGYLKEANYAAGVTQLGGSSEVRDERSEWRSRLKRCSASKYLIWISWFNPSLKLLTGLQGDSQQQQHVIYPRHNALRLVAVKP